MAIVVSDTSPIRALEHLSLVDLLQSLFGNVYIPPAVESELIASPSKLKRIDVRNWPFLVVQRPGDAKAVERFRRSLDPGDSEALALAVEISADIVLVDEMAARRMAEASGLVAIGVTGVLIRAKAGGLISSVGPLLDKLQIEADFFVSDAVKKIALQLAGE